MSNNEQVMSELLPRIAIMENEAVRSLGNKIGYGRLMQLAEQIWRQETESPGSEHTTGPCAAMMVQCSHPVKNKNGHCEVCCGAGRVTKYVDKITRDTALLAPHLAKIKRLEFALHKAKRIIQILDRDTGFISDALSETTPDNTLESQITELKEQLAKAENALRFYANHSNYIKTIKPDRTVHPIIIDNGQLALDYFQECENFDEQELHELAGSDLR